jgi:hypothetical protein
MLALASFAFIAFKPVVAGYGATCLNRHDARIYSVLLHGTNVNYTGNGDTNVVGSPWGYDVSVFVHVNGTILMNPQLDPTNGSVFLSNTLFGPNSPHCYYNILPVDQVIVFQAHVANLTGQQTVTFSTGSTSGQYAVTWLGP